MKLEFEIKGRRRRAALLDLCENLASVAVESS
jgi:hypothetical protein